MMSWHGTRNTNVPPYESTVCHDNHQMGTNYQNQEYNNGMYGRNANAKKTVDNNSTMNSAVPQPPKDDEKMPLFLIKLWNIVEDPAYQQIIRWDDSGYSFHIIDPYSFCRNVLPHYFKHNNLNSLIRQLNMYGFRKMTPLDRGGLTRAESDQDHLEFSHPYFVRDRSDLLVNIKRKASSRVNNVDPSTAVQTNLNVVMDEIRALRDKQKSMDSKMAQIVKENETLWEQISHQRAQHHKQQQVVNKLVQFLVALVQPKGNGRLGKRGFLAIDWAQQHQDALTSEDVKVTEARDGLRNYLASVIADEPPSKRSRTAGGAANHNNFGAVNSQLTETLDHLQRELLDGKLCARFPSGDSPNGGPIISDVTDELAAASCSPSPSSNRPMPSRMTPQQGPLSGRFYGRSGATATATATATPSVPHPLHTTFQQPPNQHTYMHPQPSGMNVTSSDQPCSSTTAHPRYSPMTAASPLRDPALSPMSINPTISLSPATDLQLTNELQEYLNGMDAGIDNCRDMIGGQWTTDVPLNPAYCRDFGFNPESWDQLEEHKPQLLYGGTGGRGQQLALEGGVISPQGSNSNDPLASPNPMDRFPATPELLTPCTSPREQYHQGGHGQ